MSKIDQIEIIVTDFASRVSRNISSGASDTGPEGDVLGKPVLVRIHADGVVGNGQIRVPSPGHFLPETTASSVAAIRDIFGPALIGRDIFDLTAIWDRFDLVLPGNPCARAAIDLALHDAMGKALRVPVHDLLGGRVRSEIPMEWSVSMADDVAEMLDDAQQAISELGIRRLSLKSGSLEGWRRDVRNFQAVREQVGPDVLIGMDSNTAWSVPETFRVIEALADHDLGFLEQPIERTNWLGLAQLRGNQQGVPILADESLFTAKDAFGLAAASAVDVFCLKLYKVGGLREADRVSTIAQAAGLRVSLGGTAIQSQLEAAASAHFFASRSVGLTFGGAEFIFGVGVGGWDPLVPDKSFQVKDGIVPVPTGPGLGITLDDEAVRQKTILREVVK